MTPAVALVLAAAVGLGLVLATPTLLRRLPEPSPEPSPEPGRGAGLSGGDRTDLDHGADLDPGDQADAKIPYANLATRRFASAVGALAAVAVSISALLLPVALQPVWLVLGSVGLLLAAIDARTTWLPLPLTRVAWLAMAAAVALGAMLGGWPQALRGIGGFLLAGGLFGGVWLLTRGGFGFGDVRYAPLVGAATASVSWTMLGWALVLGSLVGAAVGLLRLGRGQRGAFAYAPSILAGGYLAVVLSRLTT